MCSAPGVQPTDDSAVPLHEAFFQKASLYCFVLHSTNFISSKLTGQPDRFMETDSLICFKHFPTLCLKWNSSLVPHHEQKSPTVSQKTFVFIKNEAWSSLTFDSQQESRVEQEHHPSSLKCGHGEGRSVAMGSAAPHTPGHANLWGPGTQPAPSALLPLTHQAASSCLNHHSHFILDCICLPLRNKAKGLHSTTFTSLFWRSTFWI